MSKIKVHPLRAWRTSQGLTQTELAKKIGYHSPGIIHSIESDRLEPKIGEVLKLCELSGYILKPENFGSKQND